MNIRRGIDIKQQALHSLDFDLPHRRQKRFGLTVDVGHRHGVGINNSQVFHAGAYKGLGSPAAYPTYSENNHASIAQRLQSFSAEQPCGAVE